MTASRKGSLDATLELCHRPALCSNKTSSESVNTLSSQALVTPEFLDGHDFDLIPGDLSQTTSPLSSFKDDNTPRAELPAPTWISTFSGPLGSIVQESSQVVSHALTLPPLIEQNDVLRRRDGALQRDGSWRKKHASLDNPASIPHPVSAYQRLGIRDSPEKENNRFEPNRTSASPKLSDAPHHHLGKSIATGCYISAPISPPVGYPLPLSAAASQKSPTESSIDTPQSSAVSTLSSTSSSKVGLDHGALPLAPLWAHPPSKMSSISGRAASFNSALDRPDADFDPELLQGPDGEWIEVIKGEEGRIAVKSTSALYEVMVWLPGFSIDDITIVTRKHQILHIVADQWDEGDHAQWDIKLGEDAIMNSVRAEFTGKELKVKIRRNTKPPSPAFKTFRTSTSVDSSTRIPSVAQNFAATVGHSPVQPPPSLPNWTETDNQDVKSNMNRGWQFDH